MQKYKKLVRDKVPEIIESNNETPVTRILLDKEYQLELERKLLEEYYEVIEASGKDRIEELADMLEIMIYIAKLENATLEDIMAVAKSKKEKRGGFDKKIFLENVIDNK